MLHTPSPVPVPRIFTYGISSDPQSPPHDSSEEILTPKGNYTSHNNPTNPVPKVPEDLDSDPGSSDSSSLDSSDSSDDEYYKQRRRAKKRVKINGSVKRVSMMPSKSAQTLNQATYSQIQNKSHQIKIGRGFTIEPGLFNIFH